MLISMSFRMRVEVEALNMVEAMGAYGRHRTVSLLRPRGDGKGYRLVIAPAVSGQAIAYGYMRSLLEIAEEMGIPVCSQCKSYEVLGGFVKHGTDEKASAEELIKNCVIEDVTGFMVAEASIRRTSPVQFSYMVPDIDSSDVSIEPQFHVRAPMPGQKPQPFQVEAGTAVYVLGMVFDVDRVGAIVNKEGRLEVIVNDRDARLKAALKALPALLEGMKFGAKKARYLPAYEVVGAVAALSHPIQFMVSPARVSRDGDYVAKTVRRALHYVELFRDAGEEIYILYMDREGAVSTTEIESTLKSSKGSGEEGTASGSRGGSSSQGAQKGGGGVSIKRVEDVPQLILEIINIYSQIISRQPAKEK